jgi:hypothetical protein
MDRTVLEDTLAAIELHLAEAERRVAIQRAHVAQLECDGLDAARATRLLERFEEVLAMHITDRDWLLSELRSHGHHRHDVDSRRVARVLRRPH